LYKSLKLTVDLVRETTTVPAEQTAAQPAPLKLSEERREKLLAHFKTVHPKEFAAPRWQSWLVPLAATAMVAMLAAMLLPSLSKAKSKAQSVSVINNLRQIDLAKQQWASDNQKSTSDIATLDDLKPYMGRGTGSVVPSVGGETYIPGRVGEPAMAEIDRDNARKVLGHSYAKLPAGGNGRERIVISDTGGLVAFDSSVAEKRLALQENNFTVTGGAISTRAPGAPALMPSASDRTEIVLPAQEPVDGRLGVVVAGGNELLGASNSENTGPKGLFVFGSQAFNPLEQPPAQNFAASGGLAGGGVSISDSLPLAPHPSGASSRLYFDDKSPWHIGTGNGNLPRQVEGNVATNGESISLGMEVPAPMVAAAPAFTSSAATEFGGLVTNGLGVLAAPSPFPAAAPNTGFLGPAHSTTDSIAVAGLTVNNSDQSTSSLSPSPISGKDVNGTERRTGKVQAVTAGTLAAKEEPLTIIDGRMGQMKGTDIQTVISSYSTNGVGGGSEGGLALKSESPLISRGLNLASTGADAPSTLMTGESWRRLEGARIESQAEYGREKDLLDKARKSKPEEASKLLASNARDGQLASLNEQLGAAERKLAKVKEQPAANRSEIAGAAKQVDDLKAKVKDRVNGVEFALNDQVASLKKNSDELQIEVEKAKQADIESAQRGRPYWEAKRKLYELQRLDQALSMKLYAERTDVGLPKTSMAAVVDKALPAKAPSSTLWERITGKDEYSSVARVRPLREKGDIAGVQGERAGRNYDPYFVQTESETVRSQRVLDKAVQKLSSNSDWAKSKDGKLTKDQTVALLKKSLDVRPVPNTELLEIRARNSNPDEAAQMANAVADAYQDYRTEERRRLTEGGVNAVEMQWAEQEQKIAAAQAEVDRLAKELNQPAAPEPDLPQAKPAAPAPIPQPEVQTSENAFSTFSLNVSDVSFKLAAASLEKGILPEPASIRSEEFINAFDYRDPEPAAGALVSFACERARYPFAQNRDLLRFSIKTAAQGRQPGRPLNLVLLLDNSGSMERADRVNIIREALRVLAGQLQGQDTLSVVTFARTARLWVDGMPGNKASQVADQVGGLTPEGGTNLEEAMNLAYQTALRHYLANGINRVVLLTDGAANLGNVNPGVLKKKVEANRKQGIALDCFGIGWEGYNDDLLETLTRNGDGRYGFINTPEEAATQFAGQLAGALHVAASDVKVQVEFNPGRVTAYRQIGYARHQLTKEQFRDNTVNAAQIGAAESGTALYTVQVNPAGDGPLGTVRVRYRIPGTTDYREQEWTVPYTGGALSLEKAAPSLRLAGTAAAFSESLAASPYATEATPDRLLTYLRGVPEIYGADVRPKKLEWMIRQAKSLSGH